MNAPNKPTPQLEGPPPAYQKEKAQLGRRIICEWKLEGDQRERYLEWNRRIADCLAKTPKTFVHKFNSFMLVVLALAALVLPPACSVWLDDAYFIFTIFTYWFYAAAAYVVFKFVRRNKARPTPDTLYFFLDERGLFGVSTYLPIGDVAYPDIIQPKPQVHFDAERLTLGYLFRVGPHDNHEGLMPAQIVILTYQEVPVTPEVAPQVQETVARWLEQERVAPLTADELQQYRKTPYQEVLHWGNADWPAPKDTAQSSLK